MGPVEFVVIGFEGNQFSGTIVPEIEKLTDNGTIRILDFLFVSKDTGGTVASAEPGDLPGLEVQGSRRPKEDDEGWFSIDDIDEIGNSLEPNSSVAVVLFEHAWADQLAETIRGANGRMLADERISAQMADAIASGRADRVEVAR